MSRRVRSRTQGMYANRESLQASREEQQREEQQRIRVLEDRFEQLFGHSFQRTVLTGDPEERTLIFYSDKLPLPVVCQVAVQPALFRLKYPFIPTGMAVRDFAGMSGRDQAYQQHQEWLQREDVQAYLAARLSKPA